MKKSLRKLFFLIAVISLFAAVMCIESEAYSQGDYEYKVSDGEATITKYANYSTEYVEVTVPSTIGGYPVTAIGDGAFSGRSTVISVTLPDSVVDIEDHAFWHCRSIESIKIGKNVKSIGEQVFYYCERLTSITIPDSVTSIGEYAFRSCGNLTSIKIKLN